MRPFRSLLYNYKPTALFHEPLYHTLCFVQTLMSAQRLVTAATSELSVQTLRAASHVHADLASRGMASPAKVGRRKWVLHACVEQCLLIVCAF